MIVCRLSYTHATPISLLLHLFLSLVDIESNPPPLSIHFPPFCSTHSLLLNSYSFLSSAFAFHSFPLISVLSFSFLSFPTIFSPFHLYHSFFLSYILRISLSFSPLFDFRCFPISICFFYPYNSLPTPSFYFSTSSFSFLFEFSFLFFTLLSFLFSPSLFLSLYLIFSLFLFFFVFLLSSISFSLLSFSFLYLSLSLSFPIVLFRSFLFLPSSLIFFSFCCLPFRSLHFISFLSLSYRLLSFF